ncbi:hypothetical protein ANRL3_01629 [Anaerolineae bacterium]|nr:hypothetical protein ANRL3_01629 [Anaerolineae bacterium]
MPPFLHAAYLILVETKRPMSADEIMALALERGLVHTRGSTPSKSLAAQLYVDIRDNGAQSRFIQVGRGANFALNDGRIETQLDAIEESPPQLPLISRKQPQSVAVPQRQDYHAALDREVGAIQSFLQGRSDQRPSDEKLCDWVQLCYTLELYTAARDLFRLINPTDVHPWYFERTKKLARICTIRADSHA